MSIGTVIPLGTEGGCDGAGRAVFSRHTESLTGGGLQANDVTVSTSGTRASLPQRAIMSPGAKGGPGSDVLVVGGGDTRGTLFCHLREGIHRQGCGVAGVTVSSGGGGGGAGGRGTRMHQRLHARHGGGFRRGYIHDGISPPPCRNGTSTALWAVHIGSPARVLFRRGGPVRTEVPRFTKTRAIARGEAGGTAVPS